MRPEHVQEFVESLKKHGLVFDFEAKPSDFCVVDQLCVKNSECAWLVAGDTNLDGNPSHRVSAARRKGNAIDQVLTPEGWTYEDSLCAKHTFAPTSQLDDNLRYLRTENGLDVYWDQAQEKEDFIPAAIGAPPQ